MNKNSILEIEFLVTKLKEDMKIIEETIKRIDAIITLVQPCDSKETAKHYPDDDYIGREQLKLWDGHLESILKEEDIDGNI
jgi:hypothetical protein